MLIKQFLHKKLNKVDFNNPKLKQILFISTILIVRLVILRSPVLMLLSAPLFIIGAIKIEILPKIKNTVSNFVIKDANIYTLQKTV